jgi:hypothetical protein
VCESPEGDLMDASSNQSRDHSGRIDRATLTTTHRGLEAPNTLDTQFATASGGKGLTALATISLTCLSLRSGSSDRR